MPNVQFTISPAPGITNDLISVIYNTLAPAAEIDRIVKNPPHASPHDFSFTNMPVGTYIVKIHESPDGVTLGNLRHDFWVNAAITNTTIYTPKTFQVGLGRPAPFYDPAPGDTQYVNPDLNGLDYFVFKPGYGILDWGADIQKIAGGGFEFTNGQDFADGELYTILINNLVQSVSSGGAVSTGFPNGFVTIPGNEAFTSAHYNKIIEVYSVNDCTISIASMAAIPDNTVFGINTQTLVDPSNPNAPFRFATLTLPVGADCRINGTGKNKVHIGRGESWSFIKNGNQLRVVSGGDSYSRIGQIVYTSGNPPRNSLELLGGWVLISSNQRLYDEYVSQLPYALISSTEDYNPSNDDRSFWIIGPTKMWVPDLGGLFLRVIDPDANNDVVRTPGSFQENAVGPGQVDTIAWTGLGRKNNELFADGVGFLATQGDGGNITPTSASGTNRNTARTNRWQIYSPEGQTRPKNIAVKAYVLI